ncbi:glycine, alanine and asparagine-rich protein-like isoform X1 [Anthonomus grandis grandis]|uniref:glycine, alanine and asparagine-rich protein-like isoform X1 n=1 Tax=Anthonomus grandis grandis TaxID=2921223 RepID=UPI002164F0A1|nr:glycine, alanine and asparagine-rich protein-like isoform X1 [Anthonomus grandis grandis]
MILGKLFVFTVVLGVSIAYASPADYIPKSFYLIDQEGHQSAPVSVRNRRDLMDNLSRVRRGGGYASSGASSHASASASSGSFAGTGSGGNFGEYFPQVFPDPAVFFGELQNLVNNIPKGAGGSGSAFASSSSSSNSGLGGAGTGAGQSYGGLGSGQDAGYHGPVLFSRMGEAEGTGVHVSGQAAGPNAAFASSSSSIDDKGKIKYSVQSGKY